MANSTAQLAAGVRDNDIATNGKRRYDVRASDEEIGRDEKTGSGSRADPDARASFSQAVPLRSQRRTIFMLAFASPLTIIGNNSDSA